MLWGDITFDQNWPIYDEISIDKLYADENWVSENVHKFVDHIEQLSTKNDPVTDFAKYSDFYYIGKDGKWEDEDKLVQGEYNVYVTDAKYLQHLKEGMSWGTTAYED